MRASRIAIEIGSRLWGGAERQLARIGKALATRGHDVRFFCNAEHLDALRAAGLHASLHRLGGDVALHDALRFSRELRAYGPDALLIGTFKKLWLAGLAARLAGVPRVVARIGLETDVPRNRKYRVTLRWLIDRVAVNAAALRAPFLALPGWSAARVVAIPNLHAPATGAESSVRAELGLGAAPVVGAVARLARQKRLDRLIEAVAHLDGVHCVIAGDGEERDRLAAAAAAVPGRVHLLGHREDVAAVLAALDVFVIASDREGMSNAMVEALAAGVPVVSTPVSGAAEALAPLADDTAPGIIAGDFSAAALRDAIARVLADDALRERMGRAAAHVAATRFDADAATAAWERVLLAPAG